MIIFLVKWGTAKFDKLPFTSDEEGLKEIKEKLLGLTSVPIDRQKLLYKGTILKSSLDKVPNEAQLILLGTAINSITVDASINAARGSHHSEISTTSSKAHPIDNDRMLLVIYSYHFILECSYWIRKYWKYLLFKRISSAIIYNSRHNQSS